MKRQSSFRSFVFSFTESRKWKFDSWFGSPIRASTDWVVVSQLVSYAPLLTAIVKPSRKKFHSSIKHTHTHRPEHTHMILCLFFYSSYLIYCHRRIRKNGHLWKSKSCFYAFIIRVAWELGIGFGHSMQFARFFDRLRRLRMSWLAVKWAQKERKKTSEESKSPPRQKTTLSSFKCILFVCLSVVVAEVDK